MTNGFTRVITETKTIFGFCELEKRPRHYAAQIIKLSGLQARRDALSKVPEHLQELTAAHIRNEFERRKIIAARESAKLLELFND